MKKGFIFYGLMGIAHFFCLSPIQCFVVDNYNGRTPLASIPKPLPLKSKFCFAAPTFSSIDIDTNPLHLRKIVEDMLLYFEKVGTAQRHYTQPIEFSTRYMTLKKVKETLRFIKQTIDEDEHRGNGYRMMDPHFIENNFGFFAWEQPIRVTRYTVYRFKGSPCKTKKYNCAFYGLPQHHTIPACTKQQVIQGLFEKPEYQKLVKPLVWVTRNDLEKTLMEGHALVTMPNGKIHAFSTYIDNGIPYDRKTKNPKDQGKYWFFKEKTSEQAQKFYNQCVTRKDVMFAGDIASLGLGKVISIKERDPKTKNISMRLGVLADTGGAFRDNLGQLDQFVGVSAETATFNDYSLKDSHAEAYVLYKK